MSWHYSQALGVESLEATFSDGKQSVPWNGQSPQGKCSCLGRMTDTCPHSQSGTMSRPSTGDRGVDLWTLSLGASRAKTYPQPETAPESTGSEAPCGSTWHGSFTKFDLNTHSWRTLQLSLFGGLETFSETWPRWGIMLHGECFRVETLEHDTSVKGYGSWPTPLADCSTTQMRGKATPIAIADSRNGKSLRWPTWEHLMGWPIGWVSKGALETDRFRQWQLTHGELFSHDNIYSRNGGDDNSNP